MSIIIDPRVRVLEDNHQVFVLHPGENKRFYHDFIRTSSVFLDFPGLKFDRIPNINDEIDRAKIRQSQAIKGWYKKGKPADEKPNENISHFLASTTGRSASKTASTVGQLYAEAKKGDLVVIPGRGYDTSVILGEFADDFDPSFLVEVSRYDSHLVPARRVKALPINKLKYEFNTRLVRLMQNRQAIIKITDTNDRKDIYFQAYKTFAWKESSGSSISVTSQVVDLHDLNQAMALTNYFGAMHVAQESGNLEDFCRLEFHAAIEKYYNRELFGNVNIEISSPGFFNRPLRDKAMAGFISGMLVLASTGVTAQDAQNVMIENSANPAQSYCDMKLQEDMRAAMVIIANTPLWEKEVCSRWNKLQDNIGIKTDATVKITGQ